MSKHLELQVDEGDVGERIDRFVASRLRSLSRTFVAELVAKGLVAIDGEPVRRVAQRLLRAGHVSVTIEPAAAEAPREVRILHVDDAIVAIDKPSGLPVSARLKLAGEDALRATRRALEARGLDASFLGNPHRLDKDTSGVLVIARTREAARALSESFARGETRKRYVAWLEGVPAPRSGVVTARIHAPGDGAARLDEALGQEARTRYRVLAVKDGRALVALAPYTGRTHQIRLHMKHLGTPVAGDAVHGLGGGALMLHARKLVLPHPATRRRTALVAPPPFALR